MASFAQSGFSAQSYAAFRPAYPASLYSKILDLIGRRVKQPANGCLVDLGCGHGAAAAALSHHFSKTIALDPSTVMIEQAKSKYSNLNIEFHVKPAEDLSFIPDQSVDLVVSAQAAHWFDYIILWPELARIVKKSGHIVFWGYKDNIIIGEPRVNELFDKFIYSEGEVAPGVEALGPYWEQPGRNTLRDLYRPIVPPSTNWVGIKRFEHEPGEALAEGDWELRKRMSLGEVEAYLKTFSSYHSWKSRSRKSNPGPDIYDVMWRQIIDTVEPWSEQGEHWRENIQVENDWGTCLLVAQRSST